MSLLCKMIGHKLGKPEPIYTSHSDATQFYTARCCERCDKRIPVSDEDAAKQHINTAHISQAMNGDRARLGLRPISWEG